MKSDGITTCRDCGKDYPVCTCCPVHEMELEAADDLAKAVKAHKCPSPEEYNDSDENLSAVLAAYEKVRSK
jgi:CxxC motif-containing protein